MNKVDKEFKFDVDRLDVMMSHFATEDMETAKKLVETELWISERKMTAEIKINGVEVPAYVFEKVLKHWYESLERSIEEEKGVLSLRSTVTKEARSLVEDRLSELMNKMQDLEWHVDEILERKP